ncbi:MAG: SDR family oxidoreductase [Anaerolineae bacterium]|nr:SDR family oxidoreductase [Anaerolineae bacterium]
MQRILITGSNRGIGLELARQYAARGAQVFATCRDPQSADQLHALAQAHADRVHLVALDTGHPESIAEAASTIHAQTDGLDVLINNAAINPRDDRLRAFGQLEPDPILDVLRVNSIGPVLVTQAFADLLRRGNSARVVNISSGAGSLEQQANGCGYTYHASKAALNMFTRCLAGTLQADGIITIVLNPGWVKTDMGGPNATLEAEQSIRGILDVIDRLTIDDNGAFCQWDGKRLPW